MINSVSLLKKKMKKIGMLSKEIENLIIEIKSSIDGQNRGEQQKQNQ